MKSDAWFTSTTTGMLYILWWFLMNFSGFAKWAWQPWCSSLDGHSTKLVINQISSSLSWLTRLIVTIVFVIKFHSAKCTSFKWWMFFHLAIFNKKITPSYGDNKTVHSISVAKLHFEKSKLDTCFVQWDLIEMFSTRTTFIFWPFLLHVLNISRLSPLIQDNNYRWRDSDSFWTWERWFYRKKRLGRNGMQEVWEMIIQHGTV